MKKLLILTLLIIGLTLGFNIDITAANQENGVPYRTYAEDYKRREIPTQDAYIPYSTYVSIGDFKLNGPEDLFIDSSDTMYIADTRNRRILIIEPNLESIREIGTSTLIRPTGVYVDKNRDIFVADFDAGTVFKFDQSGAVIQEFSKPTEPMFGQNTPFRPYKISGDTGGNLYIVSEGTYQGLVQMNSRGEFLGFFGANPVNPNYRAIILKTVFSDEVVSNFIKITPQTMVNVAIDNQNRVYTVTRGASGDSIKRLNISGINRLPRNLNDSQFSNAIAIGPIGNMYTVSDDGFIREYDAEGNLLFRFGGKDNRTYQKGLFNIPSAIAVDNNYNLYVLDRAKNELQVFIPTSFGNIVHEAVDLYQKGHYLESKVPWEEVLASNSMFDLAHKGIGHAYLKADMYEEALESYQLAGYKPGYSDAFWEIRNIWLMDNLSGILIGIIVLYSLTMINQIFFSKKYVKPFIKKTKNKLLEMKFISDISYTGYMLKQPFDGFYEIKRQDRISVLSATFLYGLLFVERLFSIFFEGASFNNHELATFSIANEFISFMGPILLFIVANYLVCAVSNGEGRLKDVYVGTIYSLSPLLIFWPLIVIASRFMTLNEAFIYQASISLLVGWSVFLLFFMIKDIHNYGVFETLKIIFITAFTLVMMVVSMILLSGLADQLWNFIYEIASEVILRG